MFGFESASPVNTETLAHVVQTALTPVFLLSGIASLLGVLSARLARVSDRCHQLEALDGRETAHGRRALDRQFSALRRRTRALETAVLLGTAGGGLTCAAALLLFVGSLRDSTVAGLLYVTFGLALACTMGALGCFMTEVLLASRGLKQRQNAAVRRVHAGDDPDVEAEVEPREAHATPGHDTPATLADGGA